MERFSNAVIAGCGFLAGIISAFFIIRVKRKKEDTAVSA